MRNVQIKHRPVVRIDMDAEDWSLYDVPGADFAAYSLSKRVEGAINTLPYKEAKQAIDRLLVEHRKFGANDTEVRWIANRLLDLAFPVSEEATPT